MKLSAVWISAWVWLLSLSGAMVQAQTPGAEGLAGINPSLTKLFGDIPGFTAKAEVQVMNQARQPWFAAPMTFLLSGELIRVDIDLTKSRSEQLAETMPTLKQMGMTEISSIVRTDKKSLYVMFPALQSCLEVPLPQSEMEVARKDLKLQKTVLGKETIEGHPCIKHKVLVGGETNRVLEAITWNASDLKDFPLQIEAKEQENITIIRFRDVRLGKPEAAKFEVPATYARYRNPQELLMGLTRKALESGKQ